MRVRKKEREQDGEGRERVRRRERGGHVELAFIYEAALKGCS